MTRSEGPRLGVVAPWFAAFFFAFDALLIAMYLLVPSTLLLNFHLEFEWNVPTWYSSLQLMVLALLSFVCALDEVTRSERGGVARAWGWIVFGGLFAAMSLDESVQIHEWLGFHLAHSEALSKVLEPGWKVWHIPDQFRGIVWVLVLSPLVFASLGYLAWFFLNRFRGEKDLLGLGSLGLVMFGGALACEVASLWDFQGPWYRLQVAVEEGAEMFGISILILVVAAAFERRQGPLPDSARERLRQLGEALKRGFFLTAIVGVCLVVGAFLFHGQPIDRGMDPKGWMAQASTSGKNTRAARAFDRDPFTRWATDARMRGGEWYTLDLGRIVSIRKACLFTGGARLDYPRVLDVETGIGGLVWTDWVRDASGFSSLSNLICVSRPDPLPVRTIRFTQKGKAETYYWSIAEIYVYE